MRNIFDVDIIQDFDQEKGQIVLKEEDNQQKIKIRGIPSDAILLKLDVDKKDYKRKSMYLKREAPFIHKGCDYCLIIPSLQKILLFELKSTKPKEKNYVEQFIASEIFINYCLELYSYIGCSKINFEYRRILLSTKYNHNFTSNKKIQDIDKTNKCGSLIKIKTPGFPDKINIQKLL